MNQVTRMTILMAAFGLIVGLMPVASADLPSGDEVIANYIKASGGEAAYKKIKTRVVKSTLSIAAMGMEAPREEYIAPPNSMVSMVSDFGDFLNGTKDDVAWSVNPMAGSSILEGSRKDEAFRQATLNPYLNWKDQGAKAENMGEENVGDVACYKIEITRPEDDPVTLYFAKDSGLLLQIETMQQGMPSTLTFSDYKEIDGIQIAHTTAIAGQFDIEITINSVEHNVDIPAEKFNFPPEIESLLNPVEESSSEAEESSSEAEESSSEADASSSDADASSSE